MEDKVKKIIAVFIQKDPSEISSSTLINSSVIPGSILIHRMYRELSLAGFKVEKYIDINTYGDLLSRLNGSPVAEAVSSSPEVGTGSVADSLSGSNLEIGIDIENVTNMPAVSDYREDPFYKTNFTISEISYCILKPNPIESFAGIFCLKEAICKTNESLRKVPFNQIEITHTSEGKPVYPGYALSVSHTKEFATGVAVLSSLANNSNQKKDALPVEEIKITPSPIITSSGNKMGKVVSIIALLLSIAAIALEIFFRN